MLKNGWQLLSTDCMSDFNVGELQTDLFDSSVRPIGHILYHYDI